MITKRIVVPTKRTVKFSDWLVSVSRLVTKYLTENNVESSRVQLRGNLKSIRLIYFFVFSTLVGTSSLLGQSATDPNDFSSNPEVVRLQKEVRTGVAQARASAINSEMKRSEEASKKAGLKRLSDEEQPVVLMHMKGDQGPRFEVPEQPKISEEVIKHVEESSKKVFTESIESFMAGERKTDDLTICEEDSTEVARQLSEHHPKRQDYQDTLFVQESLVPQDPKMAFGLETRVYPLKVTSYASYHALLKQFGIPCFPFLIRMGERGIEYRTGAHALKNYDESQVGVLQEWVEREWVKLRRRDSINEAYEELEQNS